MSSISATLGEAAGCPTIEWNGRKWKIAHPVQKAKAFIEDTLAANAIAEVAKLERMLPAAVYEESFQRVLSVVADGYYHTWEPGWMKSCQNGLTGGLLFIRSLIWCHQEDVTESDVIGLMSEKMGEVKAALVRVMPGFFEYLAEFKVGVSKKELPEVKAQARAMAERFLTAMMPDFSPPVETHSDTPS